MFGRRPDGTSIEALPAMRRIMPLISPRRNESLFYLHQQIEVDAALEFLGKQNRGRTPERPITLFHLVLRSISQMMAVRPGLNRFVKGGRIYARNGVFLTFAAKRELVDGAPMLTIKREFDPEHETLDDMVDGIYATLNPQRAGVETTSDKEANLLMRLPPFLARWMIKASDGLDHFGLLPGNMIRADPLYTSMFVANLGSVGLGAGFHHLWERGTCSTFGVLGEIEVQPDGRRTAGIAWTYDERVDDGMSASLALGGNRERIENPELLLASAEELREREANRKAPRS